MSRGKEQKDNTHFRITVYPPAFALMSAVLSALLFAACSFDYSSVSGSETEKADIVMEKIEYVRVRGGDPLVRFRAEYAERWEESQIMNLNNFSFEQMEDKGDSVDAEGRAGAAAVQLESGNIALSGGIKISVESEDVTIETASLDWQDKAKILTGTDGANVIIQRSDGTSFTGRGFSADARNRTWAFSGEVKGLYVEEDDDEKDKKDGEFEPTRVEWTREEWEQAPVEKAPGAEQPTPAVEKKPITPVEDK